MVSSIARSSMPSSVQHGSTSASATSAAPCVVDRRSGRARSTNAGPAAPTCRSTSLRAPSNVHRRPAAVDAARSRPRPARRRPRSARRRRGRSGGPAARRPGRAAPSSRRCGTARRRPRASRRRHAVRDPTRRARRAPARPRLARARVGFGALHQLVAAGGLERPEGLRPNSLASSLRSMFIGRRQQGARQQDALHLDAARGHRGGLRVPPVVLDFAAEQLALASSCESGDDLHQHLGAVLVELGDGDAVGRGVGGLDLRPSLCSATSR